MSFTTIKKFNDMLSEEYKKLIESDSDDFVRVLILTLLEEMKFFEDHELTEGTILMTYLSLERMIMENITNRNVVCHKRLQEFCNTTSFTRIINALYDVILLSSLRRNLINDPCVKKVLSSLNYIRSKKFLNRLCYNENKSHDNLYISTDSLGLTKPPLPRKDFAEHVSQIMNDWKMMNTLCERAKSANILNKQVEKVSEIDLWKEWGSKCSNINDVSSFIINDIPFPNEENNPSPQENNPSPQENNISHQENNTSSNEDVEVCSVDSHE